MISTDPLSTANPHPITKCAVPVRVKERKSRNPLHCEKTPRSHFQEEKQWNYSVPPGEVFQEKWKYDQEDRPLMESFSSLKKGVAEDEARMKAHEARIKAFQETQAMLAAQSAQVTVRESARASGRSTGRSSRVADSARVEDGSARHPASHTGRSTFRSDNPFASSRSTARPEKDLSTFSASALKGLQQEHPEILAKMRAQRAAKYVTTLKNPLEPPPYNSVSSRQGFFPAGTNTLHPPPADTRSKSNSKHAGQKNVGSSGKIVMTSRNLDTSRMKESLNALVEELEKTDSQIARQELKIALAPKVKTFDKKKSSKK